jgi:hypothetical protein
MGDQPKLFHYVPPQLCNSLSSKLRADTPTKFASRPSGAFDPKIHEVTKDSVNIVKE